jgi:hypothetical protein
MIGEIGNKTSKRELKKFWTEGKSDGIVDYNHKRIILPKEFYTPNGPASFNWEELNYICKSENGGGVVVHFPGGFYGLLDSFCKELTTKNLMSESDICEGDYYLINVGGIRVRYSDGQDLHGRKTFSEKLYYPRIKADAEEYAKHFYKDTVYPVYVAQINSVPNREWDISKKD